MERYGWLECSEAKRTLDGSRSPILWMRYYSNQHGDSAAEDIHDGLGDDKMYCLFMESNVSLWLLHSLLSSEEYPYSLD
jgi:hypothetical protein